MTEWKKRILKEFHMCTHLDVCFFDRYDNMLYQYPQSDSVIVDERLQDAVSMALEGLNQNEKNSEGFATVYFNKCAETFCTACYFEERLPFIELGRIVFGPYSHKVNEEEVPFIPQFAVGHIVKLLQLFIKEYSHKNEMYKDFDQASSYHFQQIAKFVEENVNEPIGLETIAENLKISKPYICKIVKKTTGYTVSYFIGKTKINMAKVLFWNGFTDIHEISLILGYKSQSYFSRQFRLIENMSPSSYMKNMKNINYEYM